MFLGGLLPSSPGSTFTLGPCSSHPDALNVKADADDGHRESALPEASTAESRFSGMQKAQALSADVPNSERPALSNGQPAEPSAGNGDEPNSRRAGATVGRSTSAGAHNREGLDRRSQERIEKVDELSPSRTYAQVESLSNINSIA